MTAVSSIQKVNNNLIQSYKALIEQSVNYSLFMCIIIAYKMINMNTQFKRSGRMHHDQNL